MTFTSTLVLMKLLFSTACSDVSFLGRNGTTKFSSAAITLSKSSQWEQRLDENITSLPVLLISQNQSSVLGLQSTHVFIKFSILGE